MNQSIVVQMQDRLLRAAKVQHGSRGRIVQDILHSDKFIPLGQKAYAELGFSYLHQAAWEGLHEIIDEIIQLENSNGKDDPVNEFCVVTIEDEKFELPMTPLQIAAFRGHYKVSTFCFFWTYLRRVTNQGQLKSNFHLL
jgi:hypothetical protein